MTCIYQQQPSYFGSESLNSDVSSDELKIQKDLIKKGYQRVDEKIKELRQNFKNILAGREVVVQKLVTNTIRIYYEFGVAHPVLRLCPLVHH